VLTFGTMSKVTYHIQADWDSAAGVWVATSDDVPGLATEAETLELLTEKLRVVVPELLEANHLLTAERPGGRWLHQVALHR
jgi:predicted RNase H-like HicB family nuclease